MQGRQRRSLRSVGILICNLRVNLGKFGYPDAVVFGQDHGAEQRVFELADIAGPMEGRQHAQRLGRNERKCAFAFFRRQPRQKCGPARNVPGRSRSGGTVMGKRAKRGRNRSSRSAVLHVRDAGRDLGWRR